MGCMQSKRPIPHIEDPMRTVFRVRNVDESGRPLSSGHLQITEHDIILYRRGREMTVWPLHSLRKYGFEDFTFSFESGRRCETGPGIYAFRCRKADLLFAVLQKRIVHVQELRRNRAIMPYRPAIGTSSSVSGENNMPPISPTALAAMLPGNVKFNPALAYPAKPHAGQTIDKTKEIDGKREHNNNQSGIANIPSHDYCNDIVRDSTILHPALHEEMDMKMLKEIEEDEEFINNCLPKISEEHVEQLQSEEKAKENEAVTEVDTFLPGISAASASNSQISSEQQVPESRMYVNLNIGTSSNRAAAENRNSFGPTTPTTPVPKAAEYCNININGYVKPETNTYANLTLRELPEGMSVSKYMSQFEASTINPKVSESDTATSLSPLEDMEISYAVLDMDSNKDSARSLKDLVSPDRSSICSSVQNVSLASGSSNARLLSQPSLDGATPCVGYTTIDFDKTVALTSVAFGSTADLDTDGARRTRHNSVNVVSSSPTSTDKSKMFL